MSELADPGPQGKTSRAIWTVSRGKLAIETEELGKKPAGSVLVRSLFSGVSRGTERLVFEGLVPESEWHTMRAPMQAGHFPFPVKYGYSTVGRVSDGSSHLNGQTVFALHPHQDWFYADEATLVPVPEGLPPRRATLAANMETALNGVWDSGAAPGDRIVIIGAGVVGCLIAGICGRMPGTEVTLVDVFSSRKRIASCLDVAFSGPETSPREADIVFHTSATSEGLATALNSAGFEASVMEMSWYGSAQIGVPLGGAFHSKRLRLISSQVGSVSPTRRARWSHQSRLAKALTLLEDHQYDTLLTHDVPFISAAEMLPELFNKSTDILGITINYERT
ncbi:MAG: zinc-dependent alcohol dehydrogenase [Hyphomicrobiales bacterium]